MNQTDLIKIVRRNCDLEDSFADYSDQIILDELNDALTTKFERSVVDSNCGYWLQPFDITVARGTQSYRLPQRAIGVNKLEIGLTTYANTGFVRLPQISEDHANAFQSPANSPGTPQRFLVRGDSIWLDPSPDSAYVVRVWYYLRPSRLIPAQPNAFSGSVVSANPTTGVVTLQSPFSYYFGGAMIPATSNGVNLDCDVVKQGSWHELAAVANEQFFSNGSCITSAAGLTLTFANPSYVANVKYGDFVRLRDQTDWPALPDDFHRCLADVVSTKILIQRDFQQKASGYAQDVGADIQRFFQLISRRVMEEPVRLRADLPSLRGGRYWGGR